MSIREKISTFLEGEAETLVVFPTYGNIDPLTDRLSIPVRAWVFEWETASRTRRAIVDGLRKVLNVAEDGPEAELFVQRVAPFLVDNERGQKLKATIGEHVFEIGTSTANGQILGSISVPWKEVEAFADGSSIEVRFEISKDVVVRKIPVLANRGLTVVSDIDDTIKLTGVLDRDEMLRNTFLRAFKPVPSVAEKYQKLAEEGAVFHYVSASPWQLLPFFQEFLDRSGFPKGTFHLRTLRVKSISSPLEFIKSSRDYKTKTISEIIGNFPDRDFILVGDSGEKDPEVYGDIARLFPDQIEEVWIRLVEGASNQSDRFEEAFRELKKDIWKTDWLDD